MAICDLVITWIIILIVIADIKILSINFFVCSSRDDLFAMKAVSKIGRVVADHRLDDVGVVDFVGVVTNQVDTIPIIWLKITACFDEVRAVAGILLV